MAPFFMSQGNSDDTQLRIRFSPSIGCDSRAAHPHQIRFEPAGKPSPAPSYSN